MTIGRLTHQLLSSTVAYGHGHVMGPDGGGGAVPPRKSKKASKYLALEPRMMFDAALAATYDQAIRVNDLSTEQLDQPATLDSQALIDALSPEDRGLVEHQSLSGPHQTAPERAALPTPATVQVYVIDSAVADVAAIINSIPPGADILQLRAGQDGLDQIAQYLAGRQDVTAIHIISHGATGELELAGQLVDEAALAIHADDLAVIKSALTTGGDIFLYGCDVGQGSAGAAFINALSVATGADVAASVDDTGAAVLGGNWVLESQVGAIESLSMSAVDWLYTLGINNTGNWTVAGTTATNTVSGITTTITFAPTAGGAVTVNATPQTFNPTAGFFVNGADSDPSLGFVFTWDTTPEAPTGVPPQPDAAADDAPMTVTITFSSPVTDPIINIDRLGGNGSIVGVDSRSNSSSWTVTTPGATLTKLAGVGHLDVTSTTFQRTPNQIMALSGIITEATTDPLVSTAAGSIRVNGTYTSLTFVVSAAGVEGAGQDGVEIGFVLNPPPVAKNDTFTMNQGATLTGNLFANNGSGVDADPQGDAISISQINGTSFTVGTPISVAGGLLTITNAATGAFTFTPGANSSGIQLFSYTITDGNSTSTATATVTVQAPPMVDLNSGTNSVQDITNGANPGAAGWTASGGQIGNGGYIFDTDAGTGSLSETGLTNLNSGFAPSGAAQVSFDFGWNNGTPDSTTPATVDLTVGGVVYAQITTGASDGAANTATIAYFNGASGPTSVVSATPYYVWTATNIVVNLPASVAATGDVVLNYNAGGANGRDDVFIDNVSVITKQDAVAGKNNTVTFTEDAGPVFIAAPAATVTDADSTNLTSMTLVLTNAKPSDILAASVAILGITVVTDTSVLGQITLTMTGTATVAQYQTMLQGVQFNNLSHTPDTTPRTINVTTTDGTQISNTAVATVNVVPVNDPPVIDLDNDNSSNASGAGTGANFEFTYIENAPAAPLADLAGFTLTDPEDNIVEMTITLTDGKVGDTIQFPSGMPGGVTGSALPLATLAADGTLTVTLTGTGATTTADWNAILAAVTFLPSTNNVNDPSPADRHISIQASDSNSAMSNVATATIHVIPQNDPPTLDMDDNNSSGINAGNVLIAYTENDPPVLLNSVIVTNDLDDTNYESAQVVNSNP
ncbi:MAG: DUF4347 domain-containing protein, partial [Alphaproteobacteria bacterium]|nr:DUF4347 domain-containing protein [Alphaproteobacteria bacterium]